MPHGRKNRREVLRAGAWALLASAWSPPGFAVAPTRRRRSQRDSWFGDIRPEGGRVILDRAQFPATLRESPQLAALVREGRLPPVQERIGLDPLVIAPLRQIGRYGGTLRRAFIGPSDFQGALRFTTGPDSFLYWDYEWKNVIPNIARAFEMTADARTLTLYLRRGMRWSDGAPFTADDVMFWYTDMYLDRHVVASPSITLQIDGRDVVVEKVDDTTVRFIASEPYPLLPELLAGYTDLGGPSVFGRTGMGGYAPKHYLARFHPKYSSGAQVTREAREAGFASWALHLKNRNDWSFNPDLPVLSPWRVVSPINSRSFELERNPYSIWVDTAGNQLPYIDRITHALCSRPEMVVFKAVAGELDFQDRHLDVVRLPVLLSNRKRSGYEVFVDPCLGTDLGVRFNLGYEEDAEIGALLGTADFRRALSLGLDRDAFNETFMLGLGRPSAAVPVPGSKYFPGDEWVRKWATYDVARANRLLDSLGLASKDRAGFRMRRDGRGRLRLAYQGAIAHIDFGAVGEMIRDQWRALGIDLDVQVVETTLFLQRAMAGAVQVSAQPTGAEDPFGFPDYLLPVSSNGNGALSGPGYARWFRSNGALGVEPPAAIREMMELWKRGRSATNEERLRIGRELIRMHADAVMSIGIVSGGLSMYGVHVAKNNLGNVPRRMVNTVMVRTPLNALPMTFFFKDLRQGQPCTPID